LAIRAGAKHTKYGVMAANQGKEFFRLLWKRWLGQA
jgi:hypothetical protein